ncbi:Histone acetyltransferase type B subunit 2 [Naganishia onofrii]|uniref:Histone acetyltransferase type B subunit 2 n=1 Tax=Naganishia onofrii TaxID=1851511 RepID=A0ACC2XVZ3_9TREE|nr:Histone acetyltransferase type B subunit 2 [Naganishia onofrii]
MSPASNAEAGPSNPVIIEIDEDENLDEQTKAAIENERINEEYKIWKKNTPFLYDLVLTHALTWPSLTCQWLPDMETPPDANYTKHRLILGTHTSRTAQDYLMIAEVILPKPTPDDGDPLADYDQQRGEIGSYDADTQARIKIVQRINHPHEINRARYMPQNANLIATKTVSGDVLVFDRTKHSSEPAPDGQCKPDIRLKGQRKEGYGLSWSTLKTGHILSSSDDTTVAYWDVNAFSKQKGTIEPLRQYRGHSSVVEDVDWHASDENMFASVGDDKKLMIWDTRSDNYNKASQEVEGHTSEINSVAWNRAVSTLLLTGSSDNTIGLWDIRRLDQKVHSFEAHQDEVLQLAWSPHDPTVFASSSTDRRVNIWDVAKIGEEQIPDDAEDGPPELIFVHGGHTNRPTDISWCPSESKRFHLATCAEDNIIMAWQPSRNIYAGEEVAIRPEELE